MDLSIIEELEIIKISLDKEQQKKYDSNEKWNQHSENIVFLAEITNDKNLIKLSKYCLKQVEKKGSLSEEIKEIQDLILSKIKIVKNMNESIILSFKDFVNEAKSNIQKELALELLLIGCKNAPWIKTEPKFYTIEKSQNCKFGDFDKADTEGLYFSGLIFDKDKNIIADYMSFDNGIDLSNPMSCRYQMPDRDSVEILMDKSYKYNKGKTHKEDLDEYPKFEELHDKVYKIN